MRATKAVPEALAEAAAKAADAAEAQSNLRRSPRRWQVQIQSMSLHLRLRLLQRLRCFQIPLLSQRRR